MSFVGTRPEVVKYVKKYKPEYFATLLLPAGITSEARANMMIMVLYHCLRLTSCCDKLLNTCDNKKSQVYLAFTMLGMFFTDLYLVLTKYADDFKESIKYKVNIKIEENKFHENVPAPRIVVKSDADRRSAYIELLCNEAIIINILGLE